MQRRRTARVMLALALTGGVLGAGHATATAAGTPVVGGAVVGPAATTQDALVAAQARLEAANEAIARAAVRLQDGTVRWQAGVDALAGSQTATTGAQQVAESAAEAARSSQRSLDEFVAAEYRSPQLSAPLLVLGGGVTDATEAVRAAQVLNRVYGTRQDALDSARDGKARAEEAAGLARRLRDADASRARALAAELADLQALADRTNEQVQAASSDVDRLQAQRDAEVAAELARRQAEEAARQARLAAERTAAERRAAAAAAAARTAVPAPRPAVPGSGGDCPGRSVSGYANGNIPLAALCPLRYAPGQVLRADAAAAFNRLTEAARAARGTPVCVTDSYRNYTSQVQLFRTKPSLAAVPGTSNHGWGVAVDLCGGIQDTGTAAHQWMQANAGAYGWVHPAWAEPGGSRPEPWHWEYVG